VALSSPSEMAKAKAAPVAIAERNNGTRLLECPVTFSPT
jgi:hypothetical protein